MSTAPCRVGAADTIGAEKKNGGELDHVTFFVVTPGQEISMWKQLFAPGLRWLVSLPPKAWLGLFVLVWLLGFYVLLGIFESLWHLPARLRGLRRDSVPPPTVPLKRRAAKIRVRPALHR